MGEAYSAVADEASAITWNPAALTLIARRSAAFMHAAGLDSSSLEYGAYGQNLERWGAFGLGFQYYSHGRITETDDSTGLDTGAFTPNDLAVSAAYSQKICEFAFGLAAKVIRSEIIDSDITGAVDFGVLSPAYGGKLRFSATAANLGGTLKFEEKAGKLPLAFRLGSSFAATERWTLACDLGLPNDEDPYAAVGTEYLLPLKDSWGFIGRLGYNSRTTKGVTGWTGLSFGVGATYQERISVDYAFVPVGGLGSLHRASVSFDF